MKNSDIKSLCLGMHKTKLISFPITTNFGSLLLIVVLCLGVFDQSWRDARKRHKRGLKPQEKPLSVGLSFGSMHARWRLWKPFTYLIDSLLGSTTRLMISVLLSLFLWVDSECVGLFWFSYRYYTMGTWATEMHFLTILREHECPRPKLR